MAKPAKTPKSDTVEFFDIEQGTEEWLEIRKGFATSSQFATMIASGKDGGDSISRDKYMKMLAGELITGQIAETFRNDFMNRGNRMEPEARSWYERTRLVDVEPIGFVKRTVHAVFPLEGKFTVGCSPDGKVAPRKGVEFKSMAPHLLIDVKRRGAGSFPPTYRAQLQGNMWVAGWDEIDLVLFYTGWPNPPVFTVERDEAFIGRLRDEAERFDYELQRLVAEMRV